MVEDELLLGQTLMEIFMVEGHQVHLLSNGLEALKLLEKIKPDIIISDIMMPKMDGFELISEIRKSSGNELIPILLLSARAELEDKLKGFDLGADAFVTKPFNSWDLLSSIENIIDRKKLSGSPKKGIASEDEKLLKKLYVILEDSISKNMNSEKVAGLLNISKSVLEIKVKEISNKSVDEFIKNYKRKSKGHWGNSLKLLDRRY